MNHEAKSKEELVEELTRLRQRVAELEGSNAEREQMEREMRKQMYALSELVKELNCLYCISNNVENTSSSLEEILQRVVNLIPSAWHDPGLVCARIIVEGQEFRTKNFRETIWKQACDIVFNGEWIGSVDVYYLEEIPGEQEEGTVLKEEGDLLNTIAIVLRRTIERKRAQELLKESQLNLQALFDTMDDFLFVLDSDGRILRTNPVVTDRLGYSAEELSGMLAIEVHPPERQEEAAAIIADMLVGKASVCLVPLMAKDGTQIPVETKVTQGTWNGRDALFGVSRDLTDRVRVEEALLETEKRYQGIFQKAAVSLWEEDLSEIKAVIDNLKSHGVKDFQRYFDEHPEFVQNAAKMIRIIDVNDATLKLYGAHSKEELIGSLDKVLVPESFSVFKEELIAIAEGNMNFESEAINRTLQGERINVLMTLAIPAESIRFGRMLVSIMDITERKRAEERLAYLATHDYLTDLPNREKFNDHLTLALAQAQRYKHKLAVMVLDMDHFKEINDTLGHGVGDQLLRAVGERLRNRLREGDTIARMGGDEFLFLLPEITHEEDWLSVARKNLETLQEPFLVEGHTLHTAASIGVAVYPDDGEDADTLIKIADTAMYRAKKRGRNTYQCHTHTMKSQTSA